MVQLEQKIPIIIISFASFLIFITTLVGFGGEDTREPVRIAFRMQFDTIGKYGPEMRIWARTPLPAFIQVIISNISRIDEDGTWRTDLDLTELFPSGDEGIEGSANVNFTMELIPESDEPLINATTDVIPMVWIKERKIGRMEHLVYFIAAFCVANWGWLSWTIFLGSLGLVGLGVLVFILERKSVVKDKVEVLITRSPSLTSSENGKAFLN